MAWDVRLVVVTESDGGVERAPELVDLRACCDVPEDGQSAAPLGTPGLGSGGGLLLDGAAGLLQATLSWRVLMCWWRAAALVSLLLAFVRRLLAGACSPSVFPSLPASSVGGSRRAQPADG